MKSNFIKEVNIINQKKNKITDFIGYEREAAIHDLISENFLRVKKNKFYSPLIMNLSLDNGMLEINIVDAFGQMVSREDKQQFIGEYTKLVDLSNWPRGIYMVQIKTQNSFVSKRIVLQ